MHRNEPRAKRPRLVRGAGTEDRRATMTDLLIDNVAVATMASGATPYGLIPDASVLLRDGRIAWIGPRVDAPSKDARHLDGAGGLLTPGLIDCHTHLIYGGSRALEWERRLNGASYADIAREGGGIMSTVRATRTLDEAGLVAVALPRLDALRAEGVTTVEIKSGYALDVEGELRMLRAARTLGMLRDVEVRTTLLAAHAIPPGHDADAYIDLIITRMLPHAELLADAVDAFCEGIAFSRDQVDRLFRAARAHGFPVKLHAEQLSNLGGAALAAHHGALSADHLEYLDEAGVAAMAAAGTVAVLLPGAYYVLRETQLPPVATLRAHNVPIAIATDLNPGSSPIASPLLVMNLACTLFRLTPEEALAGFTRVAAQALGLSDRGTIAPGQRADLCLWRVNHPAELAYAIGQNRLATVFRGGRIVLERLE